MKVPDLLPKQVQDRFQANSPKPADSLTETEFREVIHQRVLDLENKMQELTVESRHYQSLLIKQRADNVRLEQIIMFKSAQETAELNLIRRHAMLRDIYRYEHSLALSGRLRWMDDPEMEYGYYQYAERPFAEYNRQHPGQPESQADMSAQGWQATQETPLYQEGDYRHSNQTHTDGEGNSARGEQMPGRGRHGDTVRPAEPVRGRGTQRGKSKKSAGRGNGLPRPN